MNISLRALFVCALIVASCVLLVDGRRHHGRPRRHHRDHTPSPPSPSPSATCTPKPYDFGSYDYCGANFFTSDSYTIPQGLKLKSVQLMTRHGDRTPVSILPHYDVDYPFCDATASVGFYSMGNGQKRPIRRTMGGHDEGRRLEMNPLMQPASLANPYAGRIWQGNCMNGQLTSRGIEQLMEIGSNLRDIYVGKLGYLPSTYTRDNTSFYLRITDVWRTRQSAESLLTGLWPSSGLEDDVIPFQSFPAEIETMYANTKACEALAKVQASQTSSDEWKQHLNVPDVWSQLDSTMGTGHLPDWHQGFDHQFDNLQTRKCHKLPLPCQTGNSSNCLSPDVAEFVFGQGDWEYQFMMLNSPLAPKLAQLGIGAFMSVIRDVIVAKVSNDPSKSSIGTPDFAYYSGHDTTLAAVLGALNVTGFRWPPYASQMIFELWSDESASNGYFVRVLYNGAVLPMYAAGCCEELCPVHQFISYLNTMIPNNLVDLCTPSSAGQ